MCNQRINDWNIHKNYKASEKDEAARLLQNDRADGRESHIITIKGRPALHHRVQRHCKALLRKSLCSQLSDHSKVRLVSRDFYSHKFAILGSRAKSEIINQKVFNSALLDPTPPVSTPPDLRYPEVVFFKIEDFCRSFFESERVSNGVSLNTEDFQHNTATKDSLLILTRGSESYEFVTQFMVAIGTFQSGQSREAWRLLNSSLDFAKSFLLAKNPGLICAIILIARRNLSNLPGLSKQVWDYLSNLSFIILGSNHPITVLCHFIRRLRSSTEIFERIQRQLYVKSQSYGGELHIDVIDAKLCLCGSLLDSQGDIVEIENILDQVIKTCALIDSHRRRLIQRCLAIRNLIDYKRRNSKVSVLLLIDCLKAQYGTHD